MLLENEVSRCFFECRCGSYILIKKYCLCNFQVELIHDLLEDEPIIFESFVLLTLTYRTFERRPYFGKAAPQESCLQP